MAGHRASSNASTGTSSAFAIASILVRRHARGAGSAGRDAGDERSGGGARGACRSWIGPGRSRKPRRPRLSATISATIAAAISSGPSAPRSSPAGSAREPALAPPTSPTLVAQLVDQALVRAPGPTSRSSARASAAARAGSPCRAGSCGSSRRRTCARRAAPASLSGRSRRDEPAARESRVRQEPRSVVDDDRTPAQVRGGGHEWRRRRDARRASGDGAAAPALDERAHAIRERADLGALGREELGARLGRGVVGHGSPNSPASSRPAAPAAGSPARRRGSGRDRHHADGVLLLERHGARRRPPRLVAARRTARSPRCTRDCNPRPRRRRPSGRTRRPGRGPRSITILATSATSFSRHPPLMLSIGAPSSGTSSRAPGRR